jgi:hypothetical protein
MISAVPFTLPRAAKIERKVCGSIMDTHPSVPRGEISPTDRDPVNMVYFKWLNALLEGAHGHGGARHCHSRRWRSGRRSRRSGPWKRCRAEGRSPWWTRYRRPQCPSVSAGSGSSTFRKVMGQNSTFVDPRTFLDAGQNSTCVDPRTQLCEFWCCLFHRVRPGSTMFVLHIFGPCVCPDSWAARDRKRAGRL